LAYDFFTKKSCQIVTSALNQAELRPEMAAEFLCEILSCHFEGPPKLLEERRRATHTRYLPAFAEATAGFLIWQMIFITPVPKNHAKSKEANLQS
jgi:hypothetical protein